MRGAAGAGVGVAGTGADGRGPAGVGWTADGITRPDGAGFDGVPVPEFAEGALPDAG